MDRAHFNQDAIHKPVRIGRSLVAVLFIALLLVPILLGAVSAAEYCVRAGATGNNDGSDWTNAYAALPTDLDRGSTYYIADGTYPSYVFDDPNDGTKIITIRKAVQSDHGTDTSWQNTFGDGQAELGNLRFETDYWRIDGVTGGGPGSWESGFGIKVKADVWWLVHLTNGASDIGFYHIDMEHMGRDTSNNNQHIIYAIEGSRNVTISYCHLHDVSTCQLLTRESDGFTVEYSKIARNGGTNDGIHREAWSASADDNAIIRYNIFEDISNTAVIGLVNGNGDAENWQIYGNVVLHTGNYDESITGFIVVKYANPTYITARNWEVHNNAFINLKGLGASIQFANGFGNRVYNNIWYNNNVNVIGFPNSDHDYNWFYGNFRTNECDPPCDLDPNLVAGEDNAQMGTDDPFVDWQNGDFRMKQATDPGLPLPAPYDNDMVGNRRGADGVWDMGAYEFCTGGCVPPPPDITPPTVSTIHISQTALGNDTGEDSANTHSIDWFNNPANWDSGDSQIGPGTAVNFHGEITSRLEVQGNGTDGNRITIDFSDGSMNSGDSVQIDLNGFDYLTVTNVNFGSNIGSGDLINLGGTCDHITISNCYYDGPENSSVQPVRHQYGTYTLIENNTFINVKGIWGDSINNHDITIRNNKILGSTGAIEVQQDIIAFGDAYNVLIEGNHLAIRKASYAEQHCDVIQSYMKGGGDAGNPYNWTIRYNLLELDTDMSRHRSWTMLERMTGDVHIYSNVFLGTRGGQGANGLAMSLGLAPLNVNIYDNTFIAKNGPNQVIRVMGEGTFNFRNNVVYSDSSNAGTVIGTPLPSNYNRSNNIYVDTGDGTYNGGSCQSWIADETDSYCSTDPQFVEDNFVNFNANNFKPTSLSLAVDNGAYLGSPYDNALDGILFPNPTLMTRPQGSGWDIGAYEYASGGSPPPPPPPPSSSYETSASLITKHDDPSTSILLINTNDPTFSGTSVGVVVQLPSGNTTLTLDQLPNDPSTYSAEVSNSLFSLSEFHSLESQNISLTIGTETVTTRVDNGLIHPNLGGTVLESNGNAQVTITPGSITDQVKLMIYPEPSQDQALRDIALKNKFLISLGPSRDISMTTSGTLQSASISLPYDPSLMPRGSKTEDIRIAYYNPSTQSWEVYDKNLSVSGNNVSCDVTHFSLYKPVLQLTQGEAEVYVYPNPVLTGQDPVIRVLMDNMDSVELSILDISGDVVHNTTLQGTTGITGGRNYYDYKWEGEKSSGVYFALVIGKNSQGSVTVKTKFAVIK